MLTPTPGLIVGEKYRILRALGQGGMGAVFEAENTITFKRAAIKWLHPRVAAREIGAQRLLQEARAMSRVRHRHVVDLYDVVQEDSDLFLVMELLSGELLSERIARAPLSVCELVALLLPAMEGVAAAHAAGVVHRDIKPANIFLANIAGLQEPIPKVIDFGISKTFDAERAQLTGSGMLLGTPRYVSFEQLRGERDIDGRADVYAFGVILYETLVGRPPYSATSFGEQAMQFMTTVPRAPKALRPEIPAELDALVMHAIARDRGERFQSLRELAQALCPFADPARYPDALVRLKPGEEPIPSSGAPRDESTVPATSLSRAHARVVSARSERRVHRRAGRAVFVTLLLGVPVAATALRVPSERVRPRPPTHHRASLAPDMSAQPNSTAAEGDSSRAREDGGAVPREDSRVPELRASSGRASAAMAHAALSRSRRERAQTAVAQTDPPARVSVASASAELVPSTLETPEPVQLRRGGAPAEAPLRAGPVHRDEF